ncbi:MAG TPA: ribosome biogenesis factor YjgA, partial [Burkholderiales bacterium]|nr:ribosome biogenesis factor YjgA [Burkholderiales bacterium]
MQEEQSKTSRKKEMLALQEVGERLVTLSTQRLSELELPENLSDAIREAKRLTQFGAIRRQMQYIGKLMREVDAVEISERLSLWDAQSKENASELHLVERWRTRLLEEEEAFDEFARAYPNADITHLRSLVRSINRDRLANKPPKQFRAFFRELRD